ncbi:hypothetical protein [Aeromonas jandaei]|uniref:hypothetical protein n=1 Tax=Aeromonas jandaei TaxID=650 RepID=UPI003B9F8F12
MISYAEGLRTSRAQLLATAIDTGTGASAKLTIYTGTKPAPGAAPTDQLALVALTFSHPCAKTVAGGVLTLKPLAEQMATASGAPTWGRIVTGMGPLWRISMSGGRAVAPIWSCPQRSFLPVR